MSQPASDSVMPASLTKTDLAFMRIRSAIESGHYGPGRKLQAQHLAKELGMSATPVREALRLLQSEGLVRNEPHLGMVVREYAETDLEGVYELRAHLEPLATGWAVDRASDEDLLAIQAAHDELESAIMAGNSALGSSLNAQWHHAVYACAGSQYLTEFIERLWTALPVAGLWTVVTAEASMREHGEITEALRERDSKRAAALMRAHIEGGWSRDRNRFSMSKT